MSNCFSRTAIITGVIALMTSIAFWTAGSTRAAAQCCPTYKVGISGMGGCASFTIETFWSNFQTHANTYTTTGNFTETAPIPPGCWGATLIAIRVNGILIANPPCNQNIMIGTCGCFTICPAVADETGCYVINLAPTDC